jgi:D-beta-D-heptose 7-phosphate kinase/D-beta-D-heptose 1-phosphate adenosyltransferase
MGEVVSWAEAQKIRTSLRRLGRTMVFTNGLFDILHVGHLRFLRSARALGDLLVVGLNSDVSARVFKGEGHPIVPDGERAELLAALQPVDLVTLFDEPTAGELVDYLRPDVYVKGGDYSVPTQDAASSTGKIPPEAQVVLDYGGRVEIIPYLQNHSTSDLVRNILETYGYRE